MDVRTDVREFLVSRRARITPPQAGLPCADDRRVPGLRRGEVAELAGVSEDYYSRIERGAIAGVSASVLNSVARALQLNDADRVHLFRLAHAADGTSAAMRPRHRPGEHWIPRPSLRWTLDNFRGPAIVRNGRMDLLACNPLGSAMYDPVYEVAAEPTPNFVRFTFLERKAAEEFYPDWDEAAETCVAILRAEAGRDPHDEALRDLVADVSTLSPDFVSRWSMQNVRYHGAGTKTFHHPEVGDLELAYESLDMISEPGLTLTLYSASPGSQTSRSLDVLAGSASSSNRIDEA
jgi:transcriptional regulator with XRE-family HTH domain